MRRILFFIIAFYLSCFGAFSIGETPQQVIGSLDGALKGIRKNMLDSLKNNLSSKYVEDYRTYGSAAAYDSLCRRVRVLKAANEHNTGDTLATTRWIEQPMSEVDRLKMETQSLRNELNMLKYGPSTEPELTQLQKRTRWIVKQLVLHNNEAADTLWKVYKDTSFGRGPLCFDSISARSLLPFMPAVVKPRYLMAKTYDKPKKTHFEELYERNEIRNLVLDKVTYSLVGRNPGAFDYCCLKDFDNAVASAEEKIKNVRELELEQIDYFNIQLQQPKEAKKKVEPWTSKGKFALQFSQYYVTPNWYKGGEPNATLLGVLNYQRNYKEGRKLWENVADIKLGFYTSQDDSIRAFRVNNDVMKLYSTLGYQVFHPKWYAAAYGELNTQFFRNYKGTNSDVIKATFLSPTRMFLSLGMKYDYSSSVNAYMSPAAYKLLFLVSDDVDPESVGIPKGKKVQNDFGLFGKGEVKWKFTKDINVNSVFDIFAPYNFKNVEFNWETVGNFAINRFLSTRLSLNMRFDSTPKAKDHENPKLQIQEQLSFGFNINF